MNKPSSKSKKSTTVKKVGTQNLAFLQSKSQIFEGSRAIALTIRNIAPNVISAYPITPQTHIVEDLAKFKADGEANYEYVRAESEFAAASIIVGASAAGARVYSATSSQGLLLMLEVIYNIAGMRLPIVMTLANRAISAPINIWNDHSDAMAMRDAGWIMLFAEDHQEAVEQHILAYKIAEQTKLPVMVNVDGFVLTHTYDKAYIPTVNEIKRFLGDYKPAKGEYLDPVNPKSFGAFAAPNSYMEIRQDMHNNLIAAKKIILAERGNLKILMPTAVKKSEKETKVSNGLLEYYGPNNPTVVLIAMGSVVGTIKDVVDSANKRAIFGGKIGVLKIKSFRPFPAEEVAEIIKQATYVSVIEKAMSSGSSHGPLGLEVKAAMHGQTKSFTLKNDNIKNFIVGLGGRDVTPEMIEKIIKETKSGSDKVVFVGK